jgi:uncharacterized SAM-binding protein YcdF (DUF218 family)
MIRRQVLPVLLLMGLLSLLCTSCRTAGQRRARNLYKEVRQYHQSFDVAIVPGYPYNGQRWDTVIKSRVLWAYILYKNGIIRNVIFSGGAVYTPFVEGIVMAEYAKALGIPAEHVFIDSLAEHSTENIYYAYQLARTQGFKTIALATDPMQSRLIRSFTRRRFQTPIQHLPFIIDSLRVYNHLEPVINAAVASRPGIVPIDQREGFWKRFRGTMGANIPFESKKVPAL